MLSLYGQMDSRSITEQGELFHLICYTSLRALTTKPNMLSWGWRVALLII